MLHVVSQLMSCLCAAQYLITEMKQMGFTPDSLTYGSLISGYGDIKQPRKAAAVMQDFLDSGGQVSGLLASPPYLPHAFPSSLTVSLDAMSCRMAWIQG